LVVAVALFVLAAVPAPTGDGTARGQLTLNRQTTPLTFAYASAQPGFFDKSKEDLRIILSDVALPADALKDVFTLIHLARDGKVHAVEVVINAEGQPISGAIYAKVFDGTVSMTGMHKFDGGALERKHVAGRLWMSEPHEFQHVSFQYDATFSAEIPRPSTAEEIAVSIRTPSARVADAALKAIIAGNREAFLKMAAPPLATSLAQPDSAARWQELRAGTPPDSHLVWAEIHGETARATVDGTRDGIVIEFAIELTLDSGTWRVARVGE
jgi:hypothetical protein